ncbi:PiggyBac transposable element-derived protein 3 [Eumeta japonica]|uniref:PiggyBac transposable element-derived protein 3 n=1 Tax=Eumeta variegata TaxID=151549 RepID=A0A4C1ZSL9_EUMVA|nr:PiggyBac transposable element-derived protein 3 [Eumeta japonica]
MDDAAIKGLLNNRDWEFSKEDNDTEYLPLDPAAHELLMSEEESEVEQANVGEVQQSVPSVFWRTKEINTRGPDIADDLLLPPGTSTKSCLYSFLEYFDLDFCKSVAEQTNLYSAQVRNLKSVSTDDIEMIRFTGLQILMGSLKYPQGKLYWSNDLCVPLIWNTMTRDRFFELKNHLHFVDNPETDNTDKLWKIRPIITKVQEKCYNLPPSKHLSIDEQMIPFSRRCEYHQYIPSKPNPLGLKNFMLVARDGVVLDFEIYVGSNTLPPQDMADLGSMRTRRWPVRAFSHFVDLAIVNCWIMYTRCCNHEGITAKDKLGLLQYRLNLATAMAKYDGETVNPIYSRSNSRGSADTDSREIPSTSRNQDELPKKKHRVIVAQPRPDQSSSEMGYHHLFEVPDNISNRVLQMCMSHLDSRLSIRDCIFILKLHLHHRSHSIAVLLRSSQGDQLERPHIDSPICLDGTPEFPYSANLNIARWGRNYRLARLRQDSSLGRRGTPATSEVAPPQPHRALSQVPSCSFHLSYNPRTTTKKPPPTSRRTPAVTVYSCVGDL